MAEVLLHRAQIHALVDQVHAAGMAQRMRMPLHAQHALAEAMQQAPEAVGTDRRPALADEHQARGTAAITLVALERPHGVALEGMGAVEATLGAGDAQLMGHQVDRRPAQPHQLRDPQPMLEGQAQHQCVAPAVAMVPHRAAHQSMHLVAGQVLPAARRVIGGAAAHCPGFSGWGHCRDGVLGRVGHGRERSWSR